MVRRLPPVAEIAVAAMALIIIGGITLASRLPRPAPLPLLVTLLAVAAALVLADVVLLARLRVRLAGVLPVAKWSLLAYAVMYGILEFTFSTPRAITLCATLMLCHRVTSRCCRSRPGTPSADTGT